MAGEDTALGTKIGVTLSTGVTPTLRAPGKVPQPRVVRPTVAAVAVSRGADRRLLGASAGCVCFEVNGDKPRVSGLLW